MLISMLIPRIHFRIRLRLGRRLQSVMASLWFWSAFQIQPVAAQSLIPDGSLEVGGPPNGSPAHAGGMITNGSAHRGERFMRGVAAPGSVVWECDATPIASQTDYRAEGWIRCPNGEGQLRVELSDGTGIVLSRFATPMIRRAVDWQYTVVEWGRPHRSEFRVYAAWATTHSGPPKGGTPNKIFARVWLCCPVSPDSIIHRIS